jgi:hypothetical protein
VKWLCVLHLPKDEGHFLGVHGSNNALVHAGLMVLRPSSKLPQLHRTLSLSTMSNAIALQPVTWQRMAKGIDDVRLRLERAAAALTKLNIHYAVVGGNAVAAWVSRVDESAVRNTRDVDILLRREDAEKAREALEAAGFVHRRIASLGKAGAMDVFLDGPDAKVRDAVHVLWAGEKPVPDAIESTPELHETEIGEGFALVPLQDLVRMKLISFRDKDRMHLRDLLSVGLIDETWPERFPTELATRLQVILDDPEG